MAQKARPDERVIGTSSPATGEPGVPQEARFRARNVAGGLRTASATVARLDWRPMTQGEGAEGRSAGIRLRYSAPPGTKR